MNEPPYAVILTLSEAKGKNLSISLERHNEIRSGEIANQLVYETDAL